MKRCVTNNYYAMKAYGGNGGKVQCILNRWTCVLTFRLRPRNHGMHCIRGRVGSRAGLDVMAEIKVLTPVGNLTPVVQHATSTSLTELLVNKGEANTEPVLLKRMSSMQPFEMSKNLCTALAWKHETF
jgi:hypothetical protein